MTDNEKAMLKTIRKYESTIRKYESILTDILDCGYEDLALLPDTTDCYEIIENLKENGICPLFATSWAPWPIRPKTHFKPP